MEWKEEPDCFYFVIHEGSRIHIQAVSFSDDNDHKMKDILRRTFHDFLRLPYFDEDALQQALQTLSQEFNKRGYWDFKVERQDYKKLKGTDFELMLTVEKGRQRMVKSVTVEGYEYLMHEGPFEKWLHIKKALPFDPAIIQEQKQWLLNYFKQKGSLYIVVKPEFITDLSHDGAVSGKSHGAKTASPRATSAAPVRRSLSEDCKLEGVGGKLDERRRKTDEHMRVIWHVENGQPVTFGRTVLASTNKIKPAIILREVQYKESEVWNKEKVEQTVKRLRALNMFESISLAPYDVGKSERSKTMLLKVVEDDPFEIRTRFGFQQMSTSFTNIWGTTYRIGGSFLWKNPCAHADQLRLDADLTRFTRNIAFSYEIPWTFNCPLRSIYQIYSDRYDQPLGTRCKERLYKEAHDGLSMMFAHAFTQGQISMTYGFELSKLSLVSEKLANVIQFKPQLVDKIEPYFYANALFFFDTFDNKSDPRKGTYTSIFLRTVIPTSIRNGFFIKVLAEQSFVFPIYRSIIGALRFRAGHIFNAEFTTIMPTERFYLGGATTLRGYETDMAPPLNFFINCKHTRSWVPIGGKSLVNINTEIRFPLYKWISGVLFTDMGALAQKRWADIQAHKWLGATGFGLRCATPIGPIRFDIGWKFAKRIEQDKAYAWFLTLGHAF